jgi:hypothetical protein
MQMTAVLLAHQGGWDEALLVAVPIVVIIGVLALVKRRVEAHQGEFGEPGDHPEPR